jgi:hypothetical protein
MSSQEEEEGPNWTPTLYELSQEPTSPSSEEYDVGDEDAVVIAPIVEAGTVEVIEPRRSKRQRLRRRPEAWQETGKANRIVEAVVIEDEEEAEEEEERPQQNPIENAEVTEEEGRRQRNAVMRGYEAKAVAAYLTGNPDPKFVVNDGAGPSNSAAWAKLNAMAPEVQSLGREVPGEVFTLVGAKPFTRKELEVLQTIAAKTTRYDEEKGKEVNYPIFQRKHDIVEAMNVFWLKMNVEGENIVGEVITSLHEKQPKLKKKKAEAWLKANKNWFLMFTVCVEEDYSDAMMRFVKGIFGDSLHGPTAQTASKKKRKRGGSDPRRLETGESVFHVDDVDPAPAGDRSMRVVKVHLAKMWYDSPNAVTVHAVEFRPIYPDEEAGMSGVYNPFQGFPFDPKEVRWKCRSDGQKHVRAVEQWKYHVEKVIANRDEKAASYLHYFVWHMLNKPMEKWEGLPVLLGEEGAGKGNFVDVIGGLVGKRYTFKTTKMEDVCGTFTSRLADTLLVFLDEAQRENGKNVTAHIKGLVTENYYRLRRMWQEVEYAPKFFRLIFASNHHDVIEVGPKSRRFLVKRVSSERLGDRDYNDSFVANCLSEEGLAAIFDYYVNGDHDPTEAAEAWPSGRRPPATVERMYIQLNCMEPHQRWVYNCLMRGRHVDPNNLRDAKDPVIKQLRDAMHLIPRERATYYEESPMSSQVYKNDLDSRLCWVQLVSLNDLHYLYMQQFNTMNHGNVHGKPMEQMQLVAQLQEMIGGDVWKISQFTRAGLMKIAKASRNQLQEFVRVESNQPTLEEQYFSDVRPTNLGVTCFNVVPEEDLYIVLPPLKHCRDQFCQFFGFEMEDVWGKFRSAETAATLVSGRLERLPSIAIRGNQKEVVEERWSQIGTHVATALGVLTPHQVNENGVYFGFK